MKAEKHPMKAVESPPKSTSDANQEILRTRHASHQKCSPLSTYKNRKNTNYYYKINEAESITR